MVFSIPFHRPSVVLYDGQSRNIKREIPEKQDGSYWNSRLLVLLYFPLLRSLHYGVRCCFSSHFLSFSFPLSSSMVGFRLHKTDCFIFTKLRCTYSVLYLVPPLSLSHPVFDSPPGILCLLPPRIIEKDPPILCPLLIVFIFLFPFPFP